MRAILSDKDSRILNLVEFLYGKQNISFKETCECLNITIKTLKNDIHRANYLLKPIKINDAGEKGIVLYIPTDYSISYLYTALLSSSKEFNILERIFFNESYTLNQLADLEFMSTSTLRRMISRVNTTLNKIGVEISINPMKLIGDERSVCNFFIHYIFEKYPKEKKPFKQQQQDAIIDLVVKILKKNDITLTYFELEKIKVTTLVFLTRVQNKHLQVVHLENNSQFDLSGIDHVTLKIIFETIFNIRYTKENLYALFPRYFNLNYSFNYDQLLENSKQNPKLDQTKQKFEKLISSITSELKIESQSKETLLVQLCNMRHMHFGKPFILYNMYSYFKIRFQKNSPHSIDFISREIRNIFSNEIIEDYEIDIYIYYLITNWGNLYSEFEKYAPKLKLGLFYNSEVAHIKLIKDEIKKKMGHCFDVNIIDGVNRFEIESKYAKFDLILTNIAGISFEKTEIICFPVGIGDTDWAKLFSCYKKIIKEGHTN
ncbi:helix-turn-helix domain-containing protein [Listeria rocourtiae]|uniref:helix-turn-helix domain-containing protein n=1 Tax=Listeria rocourtiae TaxID=647910 RepID=UPI003D2F8444